jgi:hypothetical protein
MHWDGPPRLGASRAERVSQSHGVEPAHLGESGEIRIGRADDKPVLDREGGQICVGNQRFPVNEYLVIREWSTSA